MNNEEVELNHIPCSSSCSCVKIQRELFDFPVFLANLGTTTLQPLLLFVLVVKFLSAVQLPKYVMRWKLRASASVVRFTTIIIILYFLDSLLLQRSTSNIALNSALLMVMRRMRRWDAMGNTDQSATNVRMIPCIIPILLAT